MWRRAVVVLALAASAGGSGISDLLAGAAAAHCAGQVCACRTHCPPKRPAASACHGGGGAARGLPAMTAACHHEDEAAPAVSPRLLPAAATLLPPWRSGPVRSSPADAPGPGFRRLEIRPPRALA